MRAELRKRLLWSLLRRLRKEGLLAQMRLPGTVCKSTLFRCIRSAEGGSRVVAEIACSDSYRLNRTGQNF